MPCLVPGCTNEAPYYLGVRLRRPVDPPVHNSAGTAIWAPNLDAFLCAVHAAEGYNIDIVLTPNGTNSITTNTSVTGGTVVSRTTPISNAP